MIIIRISFSHEVRLSVPLRTGHLSRDKCLFLPQNMKILIIFEGSFKYKLMNKNFIKGGFESERYKNK